MESSLVLKSSTSSSSSPMSVRSPDVGKKFIHCGFLEKSRFFFKNGCFSPSPISGQKLSICSVNRRNSVVVTARKEHKKKPDSHSFAVNPDESYYPEAVLLKEKLIFGVGYMNPFPPFVSVQTKKKVQEDGSLLPDFADDKEKNLYESLTFQLESDSVERVRHYEVVYLIHEDHAEEVESVNQKVQDFLREKKGKVWRFSDWGLRRLAYKILHAKNAHYILMNFEMEAKWINDFKTMLDTDLRVIRHLVIKRDEAITEECLPPPEFHTLQGGMVFDDEEDDDEDYEDEDEDYDDEDEDVEEGDEDEDEDYGDEDEDEDEDEYEEEGEEGEGEGEEDDNESGIIYVDEEEIDDDKEDKLNGKGRRKQKAEKVSR